MENGTRRYLSVFMIMAFILSALIIHMPGEHAAGEPASPPTRADLLEVNDTMVISSSRSLGDVVIQDGGNLIIQGAISVVMESLKCISENGSSFQMIGDGPEDQNRARLTVTGSSEAFTFHLEPEEITLQNAVIFAENRVNSPNIKDRGMNVILRSMGSDLEINNTEIEIWAQNGEDGKTSGGVPLAGTGGATSTLTIETTGINDISIAGSLIEVHGGSGGDAKIFNNRPGPGGDSFLNIYGDLVKIHNSRIFSLGGQSGSIVSGTDPSKGEEGGSATMYIKSERELNIGASQIEAKGGLRTDDKTEVTSFLYLTSEDDAIFMDSGKPEADRKKSLSSLLSDATLIEAPNGAFLHQVDLGEDKPSSQGDTTIFVYWWFEVNVRDNYGNPLNGAVISYTIGNDPEVITSPDNSWITGANGKLDLEVESLVIEPSKPANPRAYTFFAVITGGATGNSDRVEIDNQNVVTDVGITLITVDLKKVNGEEYVKGKIVGGDDAVLEGISTPAPNSGNDILSIQWYIEDTLVGDVTDVSDPIMPPFSRWTVVWNTLDWPDGEYKLTFLAVDEAYEVRTEVYVEVSQLIINHRPIVASAVIDDTTGKNNVAMGETVVSHVTRDRPFIFINGTVWDRDARSPYINIGKSISKVGITVTRSDGYVVYSKELLEGFNDLIKVNETGGWSYRFKIDTNVRMEVSGRSEYIFEEGEYKVQFYVDDDVPLPSVPEDNFFILDLEKDFFPVIDLYLEGEEPPDDADFEFDIPVFYIKTKDSNTKEVKINLTGSYDQDDPEYRLQDSWKGLTYSVYIDSMSNVIVDSEKGLGIFVYVFDVEDVPAFKYASFLVIVEVEDAQGLKTTKKFVVKVEHNPPEEEISLWETIFGVPPSIKFDQAIYLFPAAFGLIIVLYLGLVLFSSLKQKNEQKKKMALLQKLREEEKNKEPSTVDDEILMGRGSIKSSSDYLAATGASKGKDDFQKELESGKDEAGDGPIGSGSDAETKKTPEKPQQGPRSTPQAPVKPASPAQAPIKPPAQPAKPVPAPTGTPQASVQKPVTPPEPKAPQQG